MSGEEKGNKFMRREARMHSGQLFHSLIERSVDAVTLFTSDGTVMYANPAAARMTGYAARELEGMHHSAFIHPDDQERMSRLLADIVEQVEDCISLECRLLHLDGSWRWVEGTATNLLRDPAVGAIACTFHDISEYKQRLADVQAAHADAEMRANRPMDIFETIATALAIYDCAGNLQLVNPAFRALFALEPDFDFALLQPDAWFKWAFPRNLEGKPLMQELCSQFQVSDEDDSPEKQTTRLIARNRAGQDFCLEINIFPVRDVVGHVIGCIVAYLDITQQQQLEQQLQYAERKLRSLVESNVVGVMVTDEVGRIYEVNDWMVLRLGYSREELLSGHILVKDLLVQEYRGARARAWKTLISQGSSLPEEKVYLCKDGTQFPALVAATTINQERNRALVVFLDISDRKEAEQRRQEFLSMVNHELRTPLTVIQGFLELIMFYIERLAKNPVGGEDDFRKLTSMLQQTQQQVEIESRLVTELLDVSRMEMQKFSLSLQRCDLVPLIQQVVANQRQMALSRSIELQLPPCTEVPVIADADRIEQVINNYLSNALKYSPPDRQVLVLLQVEEAMARVSIRDQGPGLTLEQQQRIWERFYQAETARYSGSFEGLGLGLYIVRTIIAQHQGQVGVESAPGQGATFWFMLPLADDSLAVQETQYITEGWDDTFHIS
jgi:PAS domain S-box-containing protein